MFLTKDFIQSVVPKVEFCGAALPSTCTFSVDSRTISEGDFFVALKGARVDGHDFMQDALNKGAAGCVISASRKDSLDKLTPAQKKNCSVVIMPDVYEGMVALAAAWRAQFSYPVIGVTGSVGKTTTKEMLAHIVRQAGKSCIASVGTQNTALGAALNILKMRPEHEVAVFEMGISKRGEMARMAEMIRPTTAIITTIGHSHMEGLGSINDIAAEKRDIFKCFKEDSIGIINGDQPLLANISYTHPIIKFGCKMTNQIQARKIQVHGLNTTFMLKLYRERYRLTVPTNHIGPVMNGLAATAAAHVLGIDHALIIKALQAPISVPSRFERRTLKPGLGKGGMLIDDCYNASPESMKAALLAFEKLDMKGKKIAILGDMLELGVNAPFWHRQLGRFLRKVPSLRHVVLVGENVKWAQKTMPTYVTSNIVSTWKDAVSCLPSLLDQESVILVKGSLSMGLKNLVSEVAE